MKNRAIVPKVKLFGAKVVLSYVAYMPTHLCCALPETFFGELNGCTRNI
jgi:hypothetical protein